MARRYVHSQNGEDGVIGLLLDAIGRSGAELSKWAVEFGANDGVTGSNTLALVEERSFRLFYIEADESFRSSLEALCRANQGRIDFALAKISAKPNDPDGLDGLLGARAPEVPRDFDVLSIDVDGPDYFIWEHTTMYSPKIVVVETHSVWPPGDEVVYQEGVPHGERGGSSSLTAMHRLAVRKGYVGVDYTGNLVCLRRDLFERLFPGAAPPSDAALFARIAAGADTSAPMLLSSPPLPASSSAPGAGLLSLEEISKRNGTDKVDEHHAFAGKSYAQRYDELFGSLRDLPVHFLEIGVLNGASLRSWADYFPRGRVYGVDIDPEVRERTRELCLSTPRVSVHIGSQADGAFLDAELPGPFDAVVDDGSHVSQHILDSFRFLFPKLKPGGWYCIEDLRNTYYDLDSTYDVRNTWPGMQNNKEHPGFFDCHRERLDRWILDQIKAMDFHRGEIEEMRVSGMMLFVRKRSNLAPLRLPLVAPLALPLRVVSFSLFGNRDIYIAGAIENAKDIASLLPGWRARFYVSANHRPDDKGEESVSEDALSALRDCGAHVEIVPVSDETPARTGMMWRFRPAVDPSVDAFLSRDADSRIGRRELEALEEWFGSGRVFHGMRDANDHEAAIMGGMWGLRPKLFGSVFPNEMASMRLSLSQGLAPHHRNDQWWLDAALWPLVRGRGRALVHDSSFPSRSLFGADEGCTRAFPTARPLLDEGFVGQCVDSDGTRISFHDKFEIARQRLWQAAFAGTTTTPASTDQ